jgi:transcription antitermination factor NusG
MMLVTTSNAAARATTGLWGTLLGAEGAASPSAQGAQAAQTELHWYAAYTCAQHEKRVSEQLARRAVEHFLPLYSSVHRWKDRRVRLELPLFPGYVFVRLALCDRLRVLQVPSVVRLVGFGGLPAALSDEQMDILRAGLAGQLRAEPHPFPAVGLRVRVVRGPLAGGQGIMIRKKGFCRVVLSVELICRAVAVELDGTDVEALVS